MRRMLSGFLAASMVASVCATMSLAATTDGSITVDANDFGFKVATSVTLEDKLADQSGTLTAYVKIKGLTFDFGNDEYTLPYSATLEGTANVGTGAKDFDFSANATATKDIEITGNEIASKLSNLNGTRFDGLRYDGNVYDGTIEVKGTKITLHVKGDKFDAGNVEVTLELAEDPRVETNIKDGANEVEPEGGNVAVKGGITTVEAVESAARDPYANVDKTGAPNIEDLKVDDVLVCDGNGNPIPYTEKKSGVGEDRNTDDGIQSGATLYFMLRDDGVIPKLADDTYWKLKITKGDNGKYIKAVSDVNKTFNNGLYPLTANSIDDKTKGRHRYIKVELNEIYTDDEFKITLDMRISAKTKAVDSNLYIGNTAVTDDDEIKVKDFYFYMKNLVKDADNDWEVGTGGLMLNPVKNDWNDVTYYDEDGDVAHMRFFGDSDTKKFFAKLSTKWEHADYASYFNDQDAYIFQFTGSPSLSSTSRADLEIYNPFINEDGDETFDPEQAIIYQIVDGDLFDITDQFEYREGTNGDMAFCTRTRFLGNYIICQKPIDEASTDDVVDLVPDDVVPDNNAGAPVDVTPGNNNGGNGGKAPANTGKF